MLSLGTAHYLWWEVYQFCTSRRGQWPSILYMIKYKRPPILYMAFEKNDVIGQILYGEKERGLRFCTGKKKEGRCICVQCLTKNSLPPSPPHKIMNGSSYSYTQSYIYILYSAYGCSRKNIQGGKHLQAFEGWPILRSWNIASPTLQFLMTSPFLKFMHQYKVHIHVGHSHFLTLQTQT